MARDGFSSTTLSSESKISLTQLANLLSLKNNRRVSLSDALAYAVQAAVSRLADESVTFPADVLANPWPEILSRMQSGFPVPMQLWQAIGQMIVVNSPDSGDEQ